MKLTLSFLLFPLMSLAQKTYRGAVANSRTNAPIAYAAIGLMNGNTGTTADEKGIFELKPVNSFHDDTLIVTCLGYNVLKINVSNLDTSNIEIKLTERSFNLKEIEVTKNKKPKKDILNDFDESSRAYGFDNRQIAQHFQTQNTNCQLIKVKICDGSIMRGKKIARYRLRIYAMDPITKAPSTDLCSKVIEVRTKLKRNEIYTINLEKYKIIIPDNDFFIAVEWLKIPENESKEVFEGKITYVPGIAHKKRTDLTLESWHLTYKNIWQQDSLGTLLIAATVKNR